MRELHVNNRSYKIEGVILDKDGTILQFEPFWGTWAKVMSDTLLVFLKQQYPMLNQEVFGFDRFNLLQTNEKRDYDPDSPLAICSMNELDTILSWQLYLRGLPWSETKHILKQCQIITNQKIDEIRPVYPVKGLVKFLKNCQSVNIPAAIVTADDMKSALKQISWMDIGRFFSSVIGEDQVKNGKPDPTMVLLTCQKLNIKPSDIAVIGDTQADIEMGKNAGAAVTIKIGKEATHNNKYLTYADEVITDFCDLYLT